ncbi:MAG: amidohydrolase [Rhizobiales bacterium TMED168]|nr:MAG: amidohydrolase [Rhizobiales bacterium TMED168]
MTVKIIDTHAHVVLSKAFGQAGKYGPETGIDKNGLPFFRIGEYEMKPMQYENTIFMENNLRIEAMDKLGIDLQLLSPNPLTMFHKIEGNIASEFCKIHNDAMVDSISEYPDRLLGSATVPLQDIDLSCKELERSVKELGLSSVSAGTDLPFGLDDPRLDEFYQTIINLDIPLFLHPASSGGAKGPDDWRMGRFDMSIMLGYAYEETLAVATLIIGGVLDRHPKLDICISHGGGAMPYLIERFSEMSEFRDWAPEGVKKNGFINELKRLWFDAHVHGEKSQQMLFDLIGKDRLVYGTNFGGWDTPKKLEKFAPELTKNAEKLLRLK